MDDLVRSNPVEPMNDSVFEPAADDFDDIHNDMADDDLRDDPGIN